MYIIWLLLLSLITYWIVQRTVAGVTRTPVWLLWLVMMIPAFTWTAWTLVHGNEKSMPAAIVIGPFIICLPLYWFLIQQGRRDSTSDHSSTGHDHESSQTATTEERSSQKTAPEPTLENLLKAQQKTVPKPLLTGEEESTLKSCFPWSVYYVQTIEYRLQAVICKGQLRGEADAAYETIRQNIESAFGDRFLLVLQADASNKPFFSLVPNPQAYRLNQVNDRALQRPALALGLLATTLMTTTLAGLAIAGITEQQLNANPDLYWQGTAYSIPLMLILGTHELGHYLTARFHKIRTTLPYFIPVPFFLGTFGAFIQIRSPMPNRKVLFDISIAGPLAGLVITIPLLLWGLAQSEPVAMPDNTAVINLKAFNPSYTLLLAILSKLALGDVLTPETALKLHPMAVAGCLGLLVTALNLMPVGQLDGGHIVHAMFGLRKGMAIGQVARLLMLLLCLRLPDFWLWAVLLFLMPAFDEPALNDVSELDDRRDFMGFLAIGLLLLIILPPPAALVRLLF